MGFILIYSRIRNDKKHWNVNSYRLFDGYLKARRESEKLSQILQLKGIWMMAFNHNRLKRDLIRSQKQYSRIIDVGSGVGGDASKYKALDIPLICIEPDPNKIPELKKRTNSMGVTILTGLAQRIVPDLPVVQNSVANFFFCINLIPPKDLSLLFLELKRVGVNKIYIIFMDFDLVQKVYHFLMTGSPKNLDSEIRKIKFPDWFIKYDDDAPTYNVHMSGTIVSDQIEYKIRAQDLITHAANADYYPEKNIGLSDDFFCSYSEYILNKCYRLLELTLLPPK